MIAALHGYAALLAWRSRASCRSCPGCPIKEA